MVDVATVSGFTLTFNYSLEEGETKPKTVNVYGNKQNVSSPQAPGDYIGLNGSVSANSQNMQFTGIEYDYAVAEEIFTELRAILETEV